MKTLVVFYSMTGVVKQLAVKTAELLNADVEELIDHAKWTGAGGFLNRASRAVMKGTTKISPIKHNPKDYDRIVLVSPIWAATIAPAPRTYLKENQAAIRELSLIVLGRSSDSSGSKKEVEGMGFKLNGILGLLTENDRSKDAKESLGNYLPKLNEFVSRIG
jgi:flavodoxin